MRCLLIIVSVGTSIFSQAQVRLFNQQAKKLIEVQDSVVEIEKVEATTEFYDFLTDGSNELNNIFLSELKSMSSAKPDELEKSQTLIHLAELATQCWKGTQYANAKKWRALSKHFHRAFNRSTSKFNYTKEISFRIKLVNNFGKRFYCDRKAGVSELNLYTGKKPTGLTKEEKEDLPDPIPLDYFTEEELVAQFNREMKRNKLLRDLKAGRYACVGLSVEVDERTLNKSRIPTARVVVVFGARRLRDVRIVEKKEKTESTPVINVMSQVKE